MKLLSLTASVFVSAQVWAGPSFPLQVAPGQHFVVDKAGTPFFIQGDSPWTLTESLVGSDVDYYLSNRWVQGYNSIILDLAASTRDDGQSFPGNIYGELAFTNTIAGPYTNLLSWNIKYFTNVDAVIQRAGYYGMNVFAYPLYDDFGGVGWYAQMVGNSSNSVWSYGNFIGNRYKNFTNLVWVGAGDYSEPNAPNACLWNIMAAGIKSADSNHLFCAQAARPTPSIYYSAFVTLNSSYGSQFPYVESLANFLRSPVLPSFAREPYYEHRNITGTPYTALDCRHFAYWALFSGDMGHFYGDELQWPFATGWQAEMWDLGATTITNVIKLMTTRPWWNCVPDFGHTTVTSGYGTYGTGNYVVCTREASGKTVLVYVPLGSVILTLDLTKISGSTANAWWYNPQTGAAASIGSFSTSGTQTFAPPDTNDWVLVLDDASQNYGAPGTLSASAPVISMLSASPSSITNGSSSTLSWTVSGSPAPGLSIAPGVGSVAGSSVLVSPIATTTYTLTASNTAGSFSTQVVVTVATLIDTNPPSVPTNLTITSISSSQVNLAWSASTDDIGVVGYQIFRNGGLVGTSAGTLYSDTGLLGYTTYTDTVAAFDVAGNLSAQSTPVVATTLAATVAPAISLFTASPFGITNGGSTILSWLVSGNPAPSLSIAPGIGSVNGSSILVLPGATTTYTLMASNSGGGASAQVLVTVTDVTPPSVPTSLSATVVSSSQISLAWVVSTDNVGVTGYRIYRNGTQVGTSTSNSYSDIGLSPSTTYAYSVVAFDATGNVSAQSATVNATTQVLTPTPTLVQTAASLNDSAGTTIAQGFSLANTAGNLIVVVTSWGTFSPPPSGVTDTAGNTYVNACSTYSAAGIQSLAIYYAKNIRASANSVTVNFGGSRNYRRIAIAEYQGIDPINPIDGVMTNLGSATTAMDSATSGTVTTSASGDLILGAVENYNANGTVSAGTGFIIGNSLMFGGMIEMAFEDRAQSSSGSTAATFTFTHADSYIAQMVAFRPAAANDTTSPSVPTNVTAAAISSSQISLTWAASTDTVGVAGYRVLRNGVQVGTPTNTSYADTGLLPSIAYNYTVAAFDGAGNVSAQSSPVAATTLAAPVGPTISFFTAAQPTITNGASTTLSWSVSGNPVPSLSIVPGIGPVNGSSILVSPGTTTSYTLNASNSAGSASAQVVVTVADTIPPSAPTNLAAAVISASQINLAWSPSTDNVGVAGYTVFANGGQVGSTTTNSYSVIGLSASTTYTFTVASFDAAGNFSTQSLSAVGTTSAPFVGPTISLFLATPATITNGASTTLSWTVSGNPAPSLSIAPGIGSVSGSSILVLPGVTTTYTLNASNSVGSASAQVAVIVTDVTQPSIPTNLAASVISTSQINLAWSSCTDNVGVAGYKVFTNGVQIGSATTNSYSVIGLSASTTYSFTVSSFDTAGNISAQSSSVIASTLAATVAPAISVFSAAPSAITNGASSTLSWSVSGNPAPSLSIAPGIGSVSGSSILVLPGTTTTYTLTASNTAGNASAQVLVAVSDVTAPSVPTNLTASAISSSQINLAWLPSTDNVGVTGYRVLRNGAQIGTSASASYSDTGLSASTTYSYAVAAFDAAGNLSVQSSPANATTRALVLTPSLVQTTAVLNDAMGVTIGQAFPSVNMPSNLIVVVTSWGTFPATPIVTDSLGNTYVMACSSYSTAGVQGLAIFYAKNIKAGSNMVTVNFGGSHAYRRILIAEYQGIDQVNAIDGVMTNQGSANKTKDNATSGAVTTGAGGDLIFGAVENFNATGTVSAGTGFTLRNSLTYGGMIETAFEDKVQSSAGTTTATFTFGHQDPYIAQVVAFRAATGP